MSNNHAPIAAFVYNREDHARAMFEALSSNRSAGQTDLFIFSDGKKDETDANDVSKVRALAQTVSGFRSIEVIEASENRGLASSIIDGVTRVVNEYGRVIVIEDDLVTAPGMLEWFNSALDHYEDENGVFSVSAYSHPQNVMPLPNDYEYDAYFVRRMMCWGWATWKDRWVKANWEMDDFQRFMASPSAQLSYIENIGRDSLNTLQACVEGKKDVWACRWIYAHFKHGAVSLCPVRSYVNNIGLDGSGSNCGNDKRLHNTLNGPYPDNPRFPEHVTIDSRIHDVFMNIYDGRLNKKPPPAVVTKGRNTVRGRQRLKRLILQSVAWLSRHLLYSPPAPLQYLGTQYGGWRIIDSLINSNDVVISAGAGEDISFDVEMARRFGCHIHLLDPTPRAAHHFATTKELVESGQPAPINNSIEEFYNAEEEDFERLTFHQIGLWKKEETQKFFSPKNPAHVSHSIGNLHATEDFFEANCVTLAQFIDEVVTGPLAVLKMDIEGAEYAVLRSLLLTSIRPRLLLVEFHAGTSRIERALRLKTILHILLLRICGYHLVSQVDWDYAFVHKSAWHQAIRSVNPRQNGDTLKGNCR